MKRFLICLSALCLFTAAQAQLTFTQAPSIQRNAGTYTISFGISDTTDVEVTILNAADSSIVRRLVAGKLGSNPPAPLTANSLTQSLIWDGRNELGAAVDTALTLMVRVRAGMSVSLDKVAGQTPYYFETILGAAFDQKNGYLYVMGNYNGMGGYKTAHKNVAIRQYDVNGDYSKTCFPNPAGLDTGFLAPWPYYKRSRTAYSPIYDTHGIPALLLSGSDMIQLKKMLPYAVDNKVVLVNSDTFSLIDTSSIMQTGKFTLAPILTVLYTAGPDNHSWFFCSGKTIYRMNTVTGARAAWHAFPTGDSVQSVFSVAFDDSGRVYVSDRTRGGIWVYDTATWTPQGFVPANLPRQAAVSPSGDEIFVLSGTTSFTLFKYRNWRAPILVDSQALVIIPAGAAPMMYMKPVPANPVIAISTIGQGANTQFYRDDGDRFTLIKDFSNVSRDVRVGQAPSVIDRPAVDRRTETVYFTSNFSELYKIVDWNTCKVVQCSTLHAPLYAGEAAISPDGFLYIRQGTTGGSYQGPLTKWSTDYYHSPVNYGSLTTNNLDEDVYGRSGDNFFGEKGIAVSRDNKVAAIPIIYDTWADYNLRIIDPADPRGSRAAQLTQGVIHPLANHGAYSNSSLNVPNNVGNVKFDFDGNIYISTSLTPPGHITPAGYPTDAATQYRNIVVGGVYKFPPTGGSFTRTAAVGALKAYKQGLSMFSGGYDQWGIGCACRTPRFDLDPWGRLFIPHGLLCEVAVVDNNGNSILTFGGYGNMDAGRLTSDISFIAPQAVAASDNYIYVADPVNPRLVRIKMNFALDNLPSVSVERSVLMPNEPVMTCWPNPINPAGRIAVALSRSSRINLAVYSIDGRLVRQIHAGPMNAGRHLFTWNGRNAKGERVSAGVYFYRLDSENLHGVMKTVVTR